LEASSVRGVISSEVIAVFPGSGELGTLTREGHLVLAKVGGEEETRQAALPEWDREAAERSFLVTASGELLYSAFKKTGASHLRRFSLDSLEIMGDSEHLPFVPRGMVTVDEGYLLFGDHAVAFLDEVDLTVSWTYPLGSKAPVVLDCDSSQLALLAHDEAEGDTVLVLGRNSGADLWDLTPSEHGLMQIQGLVFNVDWTLLLGQDGEGRAVLKLC
jgi:hypothetical protein